MKTLTPEQMDWLIGLLRYWGTLIPSVKTLVAMIGLDIVSGWLVAIAKHTLNSTTSFSGMCKKAMILLLVSVAIILEPYANGLPLSMLIALGFIGMEGISILENAAALGIPMPAQLLLVMEKLQSGKNDKVNQKLANTGAMNKLTDALQTRIEQTDKRIEQEEEHKTIPMPVSIKEPVHAVVINPPDHPVNVTTL